MGRSRYSETVLLQAKRDYDSGIPLEVVAASYWMSYNNMHFLFKKRGWKLRPVGNKVNPRVKGVDYASEIPGLRDWQALSSNVKGAIAEQMAAVWLAGHGFDVWRPLYAHHCCDIGVLIGKRLVRCQVKVATFDKRYQFFNVHLHRDSRAGKPRYDATRVDFFLILCPGFTSPVFYVLPLSENFPGNRARFYPHRRHFQDKADWERYRNAIDLLKAETHDAKSKKLGRTNPKASGARHYS